MLEDRRILIGIGGGIAVYRIAELVRLLKKQGAEVRCIMTRSATEFVSPLTFEALTGEQVHTNLFDLTAEREMGHIRLARWADVLLIAPATSDLIARFAHGIADDLLTTLFQAGNGPSVLAPAMNSVMWESPACRRNIHTLQQQGIILAGPEEGELACGEEGAGRLSNLETIQQALSHAVCPNSLAGQRWLINAGPTIEHWDAVRFLTNAASGKLGFCLALAAAARGARVDLVAGPNTPLTPFGVQRHPTVSASDMLNECTRLAAGADVFFATAAIMDFRFSAPESGKLKRGETERCIVELGASPDIVARVAHIKKRPGRVIACAAEDVDHAKNAIVKLKRKGVDAVFANDIANIGSDHSSGGLWLTSEGTIKIKTMSKWRLAERLIELVTNL